MFKKSLFVALLFTSISFAQYERKTAIVEAVNKSRDGVVAIKVKTSNGKSSVGSGIVVDSDGYILTNYHVVKDASEVKVTLHDDKEVVGEVIGTVSKSDLAIVKVDSSTKINKIRFAKDDDVMVGETVIAIGNPYGFKHTVSIGIVSGLNREIPGPKGNAMTGIIQHSADINPGNSGGPLLNINGELIGMNVAMREGAKGIAFAINVGVLSQVVQSKLPQVKLVASK